MISNFICVNTFYMLSQAKIIDIWETMEILIGDEVS